MNTDLLFKIVLLLSGIALILCASYLFDRAHRCEISTRAGVALMLSAEGVISVAVALSQWPVWWPAVALSALTAVMAWLVIGTRYGRRCAHIDGWGITRTTDTLPIERGQAHD
ncbi:MAG: hypothetical protein RL260_1914 [Pseudomonadota bacterium]